MLRHQPTSLERFIRAVHRRRNALRVIERAGLGLLGASALATVLVGVMLWRGQDGWNIAAVTLCAGGLIGAVWGLSMRLTAFDAAGEADRQLGTADLFATAWSVRHQPDDPWARTLFALATDEARRRSAGEVILRTLGVRAWGGIALAVVFVGTLAALSAQSPPAVAGVDGEGGGGPQAASRAADRSRPIVDLDSGRSGRSRRVEQNPEDASRGLGTLTEAPAEPQDDGSQPAAPQADAPTLDGASASAGIGAGEGGTDQARRPREREVIPNSPQAPPAGRAEAGRPTGKPGAGVGRGTHASAGQDAPVDGTVTPGPSSPTPSPPPWSDPAWPDNVESARQAVRAGHVPDYARDLVRGYFDPAGDEPEPGGR